MYNILLGGAAGDGIETMSLLLEQLLKQSGVYVFTIRDAMSRVRGGHNFVQIRFGSEPVEGHSSQLDGIFAMNEETLELHRYQLRSGGFVICDSSIAPTDGVTVALPLHEIAKTLGNHKVGTSVAIGAILSLFGLTLKNGKEVLERSLKQGLAELNLEAIKKGCELVQPRFSMETQALEHQMVISGTNALSLGAIAGGLKFYSAYPMSPSTGILEYLSIHGEKLNIIVEQAEDEIAAIHMAIGASYAGAPAMVGTSGGGFCLMVEAVGFAGIAEIPLVIVDVQRPGPATGLPTRTEQSDLKFVINAAQGEFPRMVIALRNQEDAFYQTARAFGIARKYRMPVILLSDQYLANSTATVPVFDTGKLYADNSQYLIPGETEQLVRVDSDEHDEHGFITESAVVRVQMMDQRLGKLTELDRELLEPCFFGNEQCEALLVGFGSTYAAIKEAVKVLNEQGGRYGALVFGDIFPLPTVLLKRFAARSHKIINVEQNATGQLAALMRETLSITCNQSILRYDGRQISADEVINAVKNPQGGNRK